ncbi:MAG TPA: TetR/AcrR family transcriptional regulator [Steroidobacteraceae bacterium]|nr:TetR/AcrR family transcriptional regulator [Steroidobacteraceae bacterium]
MFDQPETRALRKRRAIMEAATRLFLDSGYDSTTMDDIATLAEVSKPTVYGHFADKERLFAEIVAATTRDIDAVVRSVTEHLPASRTPAKPLAELGRRFVKALMQPELIRLRRLVIANAERFPEVARTWYEQGFDRVLAALARCFEQFAASKMLRVGDPLAAAHHFVGLLLWIPVNQAMFRTRKKPISDAEIETIVVSAVAAFLNGYRPD